MTITVPPEIETKLMARARRQGLTVEAYIASLVDADDRAEDELVALALEGLDSGEPIAVGPAYWEEKHRRLDESLKNARSR